MSRRPYKASTAALLSLVLFSGLLVPGPRAQPEPPLILVLAHKAMSTGTTRCQATRRELRFGWIEMDDETGASGSLQGSGTPVCLAVYRVDAER